MSALKSVIITLPAKAATAPNIIDKTAASKLNFTTSILMDKIKVEAGATQQQQQQQPSSKKQLPVPSPLKHMELDGLVFKQEHSQPSRGKKRRLDHLTWEEKLQRKKLKNRVAAQTSRDRKKAKLDELEDAVRQLREQNERLTKECSILRTQNESLVTESRRLKEDNKELMELKERHREEATATTCATCQARVGCTVPALGSAVSPFNPLQQGGTVQTARALTLSPSASILLKILTLYLLSKTYLANSKPTTTTSSDSRSLPKAFCERLPLRWKQILLSRMSSPVKKESTKKFDNTEKMVGQAPNYVEADTPRGSVAIVHPTTQQNISESVTPIVPTLTLNSSGPITIAENIEIKEEPMHDAEMVYGTYDEATNCITIIYPEDEVITRLSPNSIPIQSKQLLASPSHSYDSMSPASLHSDDADVAAGKLDCATHSDGGYESHGSPASSDVAGTNNPLTDLWHESFSELFPSLA